jgi:two-component system CheB/CheR fusion protein
MIDGPGAPAERPSPRRLASRSLVPLRRLPGEPVTPRWSLVDRLGAFLFDSPIGVAVVDRNYDILTINQRARVLLGIRGQGIGDDIVHLAEVPAGELKAALDAAFRSEMPSAERELEVRDALAGERRFLQITCYPDRTVDRDGRVESVFVIVVDVTKSVSAERQMLGELEKNRATLDRVSTQSAELIERQHALINANNELTTANAELRGANEHLLIAAEEAEASAEEVETLNEEMQATSEELETLNEELQATVEELNTTNEELAARGNELEQLARGRQEQLEAAQHTLATLRAVVEQTPLVVCLVDGQSKVAIASHQYVALAESNGDSLPRVGETWRNPPKTVRIAQDGERQKTYVVQPIPLPQDGSGVMLVLDPQTR